MNFKALTISDIIAALYTACLCLFHFINSFCYLAIMMFAPCHFWVKLRVYAQLFTLTVPGYFFARHLLIIRSDQEAL